MQLLPLHTQLQQVLLLLSNKKSNLSRGYVLMRVILFQLQLQLPLLPFLQAHLLGALQQQLSNFLHYHHFLSSH